MWEYIIFGVFVVCIILLVVFLKTRKTTNIIEDAFSGNNKNLRIKGEFLNKEEIYYFDLMNRHLPNEFIIIPKIGVDNLLAPIGDRSQYDAISSKYVDFIIFDKRTMLPIVAIDLVEEKMSSSLTYFDKDISNALKLVGIPIYTQMVEDFYVYDDLMSDMQKKIPALNNKKKEEKPIQSEDKQKEKDEKVNIDKKDDTAK